MAQIITVNGKTPQIHPSAWIAETAVITGDVVIGPQSSVWYGVVIRGDVNKIRIGEQVNIQDLTMVHGTVGRGDTLLGDKVSVGHRAIIHGCQIEPEVLIGMGAIVLDDVLIPSNTIIAAGAVVTSGTQIEAGHIYAGTPARIMKTLDPAKAQVYIQGTAQGYVGYKEYYR
jgi:carbonic anhydrase/acetyltransferase-like protein (isoleucine patch superfamily)